MLLLHLLTTNDILVIENNYINNKINNCIINNKSKFKRKHLLVLNDIYLSYKNPYILNYIFNGDISISALKDIIIIYDFIYTNNIIININEDIRMFINLFYMKNPNKRYLISKTLYKYLLY